MRLVKGDKVKINEILRDHEYYERISTGVYTLSGPNRLKVENYPAGFYVLWSELEYEVIESKFSKWKNPFKTQFTRHDSDGLGSRLLDWVLTYQKQMPCDEFAYGFWPNVDKDSVDFIYIWPNEKARKKGRKGRAKVKPGKVFRMLFPFESDQFIESLVHSFKENFKPLVLTFHKSESPEDFARVFQMNYMKKGSVNTTIYHKSLADSCMRYEFSTSVHPAYIYGSGDFEIHWATNQDGLLCARTIRHKDSNTIAPIYGSNQKAIESLEEHLDCDFVDEGDWNGATLLRVEDSGKIVGPYLDFCKDISDKGDHLVIDPHGELCAEETSGYISSGTRCSYCEETTNGDITYVPNHGDICEYCLQENFVWSEHEDEYIHESDAVGLSDGYYAPESASYVIQDVDGNYHHEDDVFPTRCNRFISQDHLDSGEWVIAEPFNEAVEIDDAVLTEEGWYDSHCFREQDWTWSEEDEEWKRKVAA